MIFTPAPLDGAVLVDLERRADDRGFFARSFCEREFQANGLPVHFPQHNVSANRRRGTVRGLHFQRPPFEEPKLVRCIRGAILDVIVDIRPGSADYGRWFGVELTAENGRALYIPAGFAHGFQTLVDDSDVSYLMGAAYAPDHAGGLRWDDPDVGITWPLPVSRISPADQALPRLQAHGLVADQRWGA